MPDNQQGMSYSLRLISGLTASRRKKSSCYECSTGLCFAKRGAQLVEQLNASATF